MASPHRLFVRPMAWSLVHPNPQTEAQNRYLTPAIQFFGYTASNQTVYVRIPRRSTFILRFDVEVDDEMLNQLIDIMDPIWIKPSHLDPHIVILRAREITPDDPKMSEVATWVEATQDPYGELSSFWESRMVGPYDWLALEQYMPLPGQYTTSDLNIMVQEDNIEAADYYDPPEIRPRLLFWDIETYGSVPDQFPAAQNPGDYIFMISMITVDAHNHRSGCVIVNGNFDPKTINTYNGELKLIRTKSEADLLRQFVALYSMFNPDKQIYFNGDGFDMPYLIARLAINNIKLPPMTRINNMIPHSVMQTFSTPYGTSTTKTLTLPGIETIDLLAYYRRFYPHFSNHKLDSVARTVLEIGKNDLSIEDMREAVQTGDPHKMIAVIDYSYIDSLRLYELWESSDIDLTLETVCNKIGVSASMLLRDELSSLIHRVAFHIDPGTVLLEGDRNPVGHLLEAPRGIYRHIHLYDYSKLYLNLMRTHGNYLMQQLGKRLKYAPPPLIAAAFFSKYANGTQLREALRATLSELLQTKIVVSIDLTTIRATAPVSDNRFTHLAMIPCFVSIAKASYIDISIRNEMEPHGLNRLCRPPFELARNLIQAYLLNVYMRRDPGQIPDPTTVSVERLTLTAKIEDVFSLDSQSVKYTLAQQYGAAIYPPGITVGYVMTEAGPLLVSKLTPTTQLDYKYYTDLLRQLFDDLRQLPISDY